MAATSIELQRRRWLALALALLLKELPAAVGIAGPAYGQRNDPYDVLLVAKDGSATTYQRH